jgi:hypothetical protein
MDLSPFSPYEDYSLDMRHSFKLKPRLKHLPSTRVKEEVIVIGFNHPQTLSLSPKTVTHPTTKLGHLNTSPTMLMGFQIQIQGLLVKSVTKLVTRQGFAIGGMTKIKNGNLNQNSRHTILNPLPLIKI